jgi:single-stranded-DNA-specific exonuclease
VLAIDAVVELPDLTLDLVAEINRLAPFGPGNPPLTLAVRDLHLTGDAAIGRTGEHRRLTVEDDQERSQTVFWWQGADWPLPEGRFDLALTVRASDFRGMAEVQVEWIDARGRERERAEVRAGPQMLVRDYRSVSNAEAVLQGLLADGDIEVWAEGVAPADVSVHTRLQLASAQRLVVWTLPPGPREMATALSRVAPEEVVWFAHDPGLDDTPALLSRLAGLVKHALQAREGQIDLEAAAAALAHRAATVQAGLDWLAARGQITILHRDNDHWRLAAGAGQSDPPAVQTARVRLDALLAETAAYRNYLRTAPLTALSNG